ncbi:hypothetical protein ACHAWF_015447 [Thalassiosira exigua]
MSQTCAPLLSLLRSLSRSRAAAKQRSSPMPAVENYQSTFAGENGCDQHPNHDGPKPKPEHSALGIACIMAGSFLAAVMFLVVKLLAGRASSFQLLFYRGAVQVALSWLTLRCNRSSPNGDPNGDPNSLWPDNSVGAWLVLRAALGAAAVCAWFWGCQVLPLPDAVTLQFTSPPFAAAFAVCMVGEPWLPLDIVGAVVCLAGVAFIAHPTWLFGDEATGADDEGGDDLILRALGVVVTTAGAALAGLAYVCVRVIGNRASAVVMVFYYGLVSVPVAVLGAAFFEGDWNVFAIRGHAFVRDAVLILFVGVLGHSAQWLLNVGLQKETAATATLGTTTQIVWTYIFELAFLHEALNAWSLGGTSLILGYMLVVAMAKLKSLPRYDDGKGVLTEKAPLVSNMVEEGRPPGHDPIR